MARPLQQVKVYAVQNRRGWLRVKQPYVVRYTIDGRHRSKSYRTKAEAERYRSELLKAVHAGGRFDETTGEPESWQLPLADLGVHDWARRWLATPMERVATTDPLLDSSIPLQVRRPRHRRSGHGS